MQYYFLFLYNFFEPPFLVSHAMNRTKGQTSYFFNQPGTTNAKSGSSFNLSTNYVYLLQAYQLPCYSDNNNDDDVSLENLSVNIATIFERHQFILTDPYFTL